MCPASNPSFVPPAPAPSRPAGSPAIRPSRLLFAGRSSELFAIWVVNLLLTVVTLGIYRFWARTRLRRYVWAHMAFDGEPLEYLGTGKELCLGFLKALCVLVPIFALFAALEFVFIDSPWYVRLAVGIPQYGLIYALYFLGRYAARRYQMSRTAWRGIRFQQTGSPWRYCGMALAGLLLSIATLGLYIPFNSVRLKHYEIEHWRFGNTPFEFRGQGRDLFKPFLIAWLLALPTLFLSFVWYGARAARFYAQATRFQAMSFALPINGGQLFRLYAGNLALIVISLGLLYPMTIRRSMSFWCNRLEIAGELEVATITQAPRGAATGEGLAGYFGMTDAAM